MAKLSMRDLWGKLTEKKAMKPEVRDMLLSLDTVYEPVPRADASKSEMEPKSTGQGPQQTSHDH